jgi:uncharacterized repeat protein (TIGR03803 family)
MWHKTIQACKPGLVRKGEFRMKRLEQSRSGIGRMDFWMMAAAAAVATLLIVAATQAHAQTFTVIHSFDGPDGANPGAGLTLDRSGNLYGTTEHGGNTGGNCFGEGCGTVFELKHARSGWVLDTLYKFTGIGDGLLPIARAVFGPDGALYTTAYCCSGGAVINLRPPATVCKSASCFWTGTVILQFGYLYGTQPSGDLTFDAAGNIYGTTVSGGNDDLCGGLGCGTVYQLTKTGSTWTQNILYKQTEAADDPDSGVILDGAGNLYGTAPGGFTSNGAVFELTPSGSGWTESFPYFFTFTSGNGAFPFAGLIFDNAGNLYGAAAHGGPGGGGTVFELSPSGSGWNFNLLYGLPGNPDNPGPEGTLLMDSAGNLYGTTLKQGAHGLGNVFKLTPSYGGWSYASLYDFAGAADGGYPTGILVMDASGNLYGTTNEGGTYTEYCEYGCGVVFEITP